MLVFVFIKIAFFPQPAEEGESWLPSGIVFAALCTYPQLSGSVQNGSMFKWNWFLIWLIYKQSLGQECDQYLHVKPSRLSGNSTKPEKAGDNTINLYLLHKVEMHSNTVLHNPQSWWLVLMANVLSISGLWESSCWRGWDICEDNYYPVSPNNSSTLISHKHQCSWEFQEWMREWLEVGLQMCGCAKLYKDDLKCYVYSKT